MLMQSCAAKWMKNTERLVTWAGTPARRQMHGAKCSHDPGATITTAPEEAVSRIQLQLHSLPVKKVAQTQISGENRHLQDAKFRWMKWQKTGWRTFATKGPPASARSFTLPAGHWTRPDYLANRVDQKNEGHLRKKFPKISHETM